ncbi:MAG: peptide ABC transporter substrate-binding protein [Candidatus Dormiibacterota bacterium]
MLHINITTEPTTLDPTQQQWVYDADVGRMVFESLLVPKADLSDVKPGAASSYDVSSDGLTWTFHLRSDGKFSDGTPVTAADFLTSYKRILDPTVAAAYESFFGLIAGTQNYANVDAKNPAAVKSYLDGLGLSAPDDHTFVIKLQSAAPYFKWIAALWLAAPLKASEIAAAGSSFGALSADAPTKIIGNGAFKISEVAPKDHITIVPNPNYRTKPILQKVIFYEITDANVEYANFLNGQLDMTTVIPPANVALVQNDPTLSKQAVRTPTLTTFWIDYNTTKAPFDNVDLRLAFSKSIDRTSYVTNILKGVGTPITSMIPKGMSGYGPTNTQSFDCTAAKAELAKAKAAGVTDAQLANIHFEYRNSATRKTSSEFLQAQWKGCLGINVILDAKDSASVSQDLRKLNYQISGFSGWQADYPDGQDWYDIFLTGSGNQFSGWSNTEYDNQVKIGDNSPKSSDRATAYTAAEKILDAQAPVTFVFQNINFFLVSPKLKGITYSAIDDYWYGDVGSALTQYISQ